MRLCVCDACKNYTIRLLVIKHNVDDAKVNDGCMLLAIGAAIGAAALLSLTIIVATAVYFCHRRPSVTAKKRVRVVLNLYVLFYVCFFAFRCLTI